MSKKSKTLVAEPIIGYGNQSWFEPTINNSNYLFEDKSIPYSGSSVHYENREIDRTWRVQTEQRIQPFSILLIRFNENNFNKNSSIEQILLKKKEFEYYVNEWKANRNSKSSILKSISNKNYQIIIKFGKKVLPLIFQEMAQTPEDWFEALFEITGEDPIPKEHYGNFIEMTNDWLKWAKQHKYL